MANPMSANLPLGLALLTGTWLPALIASSIEPYDRTTWWMEVAPVLIAMPALWTTKSRLVLTNLALTLIGVHGLALILGGAYTYARVPIGYDIQQWLNIARNPYDRFGHFLQGFTPAIVFRELLIRAGRIPRGLLLQSLVIACCLAVSATYELLEFAAAIALGQGADDFLGTQGDPWDTQWDMLMCLIGALSSLILLTAVHDRGIAKHTGRSTKGTDDHRD